jgi:hypothetical protein
MHKVVKIRLWLWLLGKLEGKKNILSIVSRKMCPREWRCGAVWGWWSVVCTWIPSPALEKKFLKNVLSKVCLLTQELLHYSISVCAYLEVNGRELMDSWSPACTWQGWEREHSARFKTVRGSEQNNSQRLMQRHFNFWTKLGTSI